MIIAEFFSNLGNLKEEAWKSQGFNGIRTCDLNEHMLYQLSSDATHWERGQFIEMMWTIYELIHIRTAVGEWSSQWIFPI